MIRIFRHYIPKPLFALGTLEALVFVLAFYVARLWGPPVDGISIFSANSMPGMLAFVMIMGLAMTAMGLYERQSRILFLNSMLRVILSFIFGFVFLALVVYYLSDLTAIKAEVILTQFIVALIGVLILRLIFERVNIKYGLIGRRMLVVGAGPAAAKIDENLRRKVDRRSFNIIGYVPAASGEAVVPAGKCLRKFGTLLDLVNKYQIEEIVVAADDCGIDFPLDELLDCRMNGINVIDLLTFFERHACKIMIPLLHPSWLVFAEGIAVNGARSLTKRLFDISFSTFIIMLSWPLMLLAAIAILIEGGFRGPVLYFQYRVGAGGRLFKLYKFRSMILNAEEGGPVWARRNDARVTHIGALIRKARLDELPQLFNVLKGEMSFVGPRPERPEFVSKLSENIPFYNERHRVKPGITGWAQVCYPYGATEKDALEKLQYDLYYMKNYSFALDIMIAIQTLQVVLWGKGAR
ncbi:MAG: TIGR03013 family PEP-CTERM/XrtA system glycosyltransferase [Gammaproteobacteria bacterium]|nr:TIGR03013 family PEP-CTERM/XrtA system glycosyltransferase [Gammaproteobacteria bacterium]